MPWIRAYEARQDDRDDVARHLDNAAVDVDKAERKYSNPPEEPFAHGGKTQGYNDKLDESLGSRHGAGRSKEQSRKDRRDESEAMEKSMGRRKYAAVGTMDMGDRMMAHGGTTGRETITYKVYNMKGDVIRSGDSIVDYDKETITLPDGKTYKVKDDYEYTMKWQKTQVKARGGIHGLVKTIKEFSSPDSAFNISYGAKFAPKQMAKGGKTQGYNDKLDESLGSRRGAGHSKEQSRKDRRDERKRWRSQWAVACCRCWHDGRGG